MCAAAALWRAAAGSPAHSRCVSSCVPVRAACSAFFWCSPGSRIESDSQSLNLGQLTDVYLGKQTDIFKSSAATAADPAKCISLLDARQSLNLESDTTEQLSSFLFGLQSLLNKGGRDVMVDTNEEAGPASPKAAASSSSSSSGKKAPSKRFSIMTSNVADIEKSRYANFRRALLALPEDENLSMMSEGRDFYVWAVDEVSGRVSKSLQHVYYVSEAASAATAGAATLKLGALYYNDVGKKEMNPARRMVIGELTDVFVGKSGSGMHVHARAVALLCR
jgi:hypothetical protein